MVIPSVRKQQNSSKKAAVYIGSPRLRLLCGEIVVATDAMVEQVIHHPLCDDSLISLRTGMIGSQACSKCLWSTGFMIMPPGFLMKD
jgi:hypothetical protein